MFSTPFLIWAAISAGLYLFYAAIFAAKTPKTLIGSSAIGAVMGYLMAFILHPPLSATMMQTYAAIALLNVLAAANAGLFVEAAWLAKPKETRGSAPTSWYIILSTFGVPAVLGCLYVVTSFAPFHGGAVGREITVQEQDWSALSLVDHSQVTMVSSSAAMKIAAGLIASAGGWEQAANIGPYDATLTKVMDHSAYLVSLKQKSIFSWFDNRHTPGYVVVSPGDKNDATLVSDRQIAYGPAAYFGNNVYNHIYENGYFGSGFTRATLEVDSGGTPHWVIGLTENSIGFDVPTVVKWVVVDAESGFISEFSAAELPTWVSRAYSEDYIKHRLNAWLCAQVGAWRCASGQDDLKVRGDLVSHVSASGDIILLAAPEYRYANDQAPGMFAVNARTGEVTLYSGFPVSEPAARSILKGDFKANPLVPTLLGGDRVWFATLDGGAGVRRGYGFVSMIDGNVFGTGETIQAAITDYKRRARLKDGDASLSIGDEADMVAFYGLIRSIQPQQVNGKTIFYVTLEGKPDKMFEVEQAKAGEVLATLPGDPVRIAADGASLPVVYATSFDNLLLSVEGLGLDTEDPAAMEVLNAARVARTPDRPTLDEEFAVDLN